MNLDRKKRIGGFVLVMALLLVSFVAAATAYSGYQNYFSYYGAAGGNPASQYYFPTIDPQACGEAGGQDFIMEILPGSCSPNVVRSDLLEEQNVPVFCKLTSLKVNPLIDVPHVKSINILGTPPKGVKTVLFHPYRAAVKKTSIYNDLIGSPINNDLGYVVVVLDRIAAEKDMPDSVSANLTARIEYDVSTSFGITQDNLILPMLSEKEWQADYKHYSFWDGRGYVRAESITDKNAKISVYVSPGKSLSSFNLEKGKRRSPIIYMPGMYCSSGLQVGLKNIVQPKAKAVLDINGRRVEVIEDVKILNGKCKVSRVESTPYSFGGNIELICPDKVYSLDRKGTNAKLLIDGVNQKPEGYVVGDTFKLGNKEYSIAFANNYLIFKANNERIEKKLMVLQRVKQNQSLKSINKKVSAVLSKGFYKDESGLLGAVKEVKSSFSDVEIILGSGKVNDVNVQIDSIKGIAQNNYPDLVEKYFNLYKENYEKIIEDLPNEKEGEEGEFYGERALLEAAILAKELGKDHDRIKIYEELIERYPFSNSAGEARIKLEDLYSGGSSETASQVINVAGDTFFVSLDRVTEPDKAESNVVLLIDGIRRSNLGVGDFVDRDRTWFIKSISDKKVNFERIGKEQKETRGDREINLNGEETLGNSKIKVQKINIERFAIVSVFPYSKEGKSFANFSVNIGIDKRAIKLSTDQTKDLIGKLDKTISDLEQITDRLGEVVENWKKVCLAGSAALWVENFFENLIQKGEAIARREVMREVEIEGAKGFMGWCSNEKNWKRLGEFGLEGEATNFKECIFMSGKEIDKRVESGKDAIKRLENLNDKYRTVKEGGLVKGSCLLGKFLCSESLNESKVVGLFQENQLDKYGLSAVGGLTTGEVNNALGNFSNLYAADRVSLDDIKELDFDVALLQDCRKEENEGPFCEGIEQRLEKKLTGYRDSYSDLTRQKATGRFFATRGHSNVPLLTNQVEIKKAEVVEFRKLNETLKNALNKAGSFKNTDNIALFGASFRERIIGASSIKFEQAIGDFAAVVTRTSTELYTVDDGNRYYKFEATSDGKGTIAKEANESEKRVFFLQASSFTARPDCDFAPAQKEVQYWGSGPFKGFPAVIHLGEFGGKKGWYAATKPYGDTLQSGLTKVNAYDESGQPNVFYIANVGKNARVDFGTNPAVDDTSCSQLFPISETYSGQTVLPGLEDEKQTRQLVNRAVTCMKQAADKAGKAKKGEIISTSCGKLTVGEVKSPAPEMECEDFMSPFKCSLMYNLCDPVVCPPSRCDWGGRFRTDNVIQTGIIGSLFLCFPNRGTPFTDGGVVVPFCMSGVHAGLDSLNSMMKSVRGCLQESLDTGRNVGICDQLQSVFLCEFFWKEITPFVKVGIPTLVERTIYGRRGGGEYLTFAETYDNSVKQVQFFTQFYGENMLKAFQVRSTEEAGSLVCKAFIGLRYPNAANIFDELAKPESPPQINAWFDEVSFSTVTVPPTSQYKVFWHIFAGRDAPAYWQVYLKDPPLSPGAILPERYIIQTGYAPKGEYSTESRDFTAPAGYKQLCVRINLDEECGFKKVNTGFGVQEITDYYVTQQTVPDYDIKTESECISGKSTLLSVDSVPDALLSVAPLVTQPTVGGLEETFRPSIQRRGIVRTCSGGNPGASVGSDRWSRVGFCDEAKQIGCWLDRESVAGAINDLGLRNLTLDNARGLSESLLEEEAGLVSINETGAIMKDLDVKISALVKEIQSVDVRNLRDKEKSKRVDTQIQKLLRRKLVNDLKRVVEFGVSKNSRARAQLALTKLYGSVVLHVRGEVTGQAVSESIQRLEFKKGEVGTLGKASVNFATDSFVVDRAVSADIAVAYDRLSADKDKTLVIVGYRTEGEKPGVSLERAKNVYESMIGDTYEAIFEQDKRRLSYRDGGISSKKGVELELVDCKVVGARWNVSEAKDGEEVGITVNGAGNCNGLNFNIAVLAEGPLLNYGGDTIKGLEDHKKLIAKFSGNIAKTTWIAKWENRLLWDRTPDFDLLAYFVYGKGYHAKGKESLEVGLN